MSTRSGLALAKVAPVLLRLLLLFTLVPLVELVLLLWLSDLTDWRVTLALVLGTGIVGAWLARRQGWRVWQRLQEELRRGKLPADSLQDGLMILVAGALLVTPGLLTDLTGFLLLAPPFRRVVKSYLMRRLRARFRIDSFRVSGLGSRSDDGVIDVESRPADSREERGR